MILFKINYPLNLQSVYESIYLFSFLFYYFLLLLSSCWGLVRGLILIPSAVYPHTHNLFIHNLVFTLRMDAVLVVVLLLREKREVKRRSRRRKVGQAQREIPSRYYVYSNFSGFVAWPDRSLSPMLMARN